MSRWSGGWLRSPGSAACPGLWARPAEREGGAGEPQGQQALTTVPGRGWVVAPDLPGPGAGPAGLCLSPWLPCPGPPLAPHVLIYLQGRFHLFLPG